MLLAFIVPCATGLYCPPCYWPLLSPVLLAFIVPCATGLYCPPYYCPLLSPRATGLVPCDTGLYYPPCYWPLLFPRTTGLVPCATGLYCPPCCWPLLSPVLLAFIVPHANGLYCLPVLLTFIVPRATGLYCLPVLLVLSPVLLAFIVSQCYWPLLSPVILAFIIPRATGLPRATDLYYPLCNWSSFSSCATGLYYPPCYWPLLSPVLLKTQSCSSMIAIMKGVTIWNRHTLSQNTKCLSTAFITNKSCLLTVDGASTGSITECGMVNGPDAQLSGILHTEIVAIATVQHTICIGGP